MCSGGGTRPSATTTCTCWTLVSTAATGNQSKRTFSRFGTFFTLSLCFSATQFEDFRCSVSTCHVKMCVFSGLMEFSVVKTKGKAPSPRR